MGYWADKAVTSAYRQQKRQHDWNKANKGGPWTLLAFLFTLVPFGLVAPFAYMILGDPVPAWSWLALAAGIAVLLASPRIAGHAPASARRVGAKYDALYERQKRGDVLASPAFLEKRAELLEELDEQRKILREQARGPVTGVLPATRPHPAQAGLAGDREARVADLFSVDCPVCTAKKGTPCALRPYGTAFVIVRKTPVAFCHPGRMLDSVLYGTAVADEILAQFGNNIPEELRVSLEGARKEADV